MIIAALLPLWSMAAPPDAAPRRVAIVVGSNAACAQRPSGWWTVSETRKVRTPSVWSV